MNALRLRFCFGRVFYVLSFDFLWVFVNNQIISFVRTLRPFVWDFVFKRPMHLIAELSTYKSLHFVCNIEKTVKPSVNQFAGRINTLQNIKTLLHWIEWNSFDFISSFCNKYPETTCIWVRMRKEINGG